MRIGIQAVGPTLAEGKKVLMRIWEDIPSGDFKSPSQRVYETVGYVLKERAELYIGKHAVVLEPESCWLVPEGTPHTYRILEATNPPAQVRGWDFSI